MKSATPEMPTLRLPAAMTAALANAEQALEAKRGAQRAIDDADQKLAAARAARDEAARQLEASQNALAIAAERTPTLRAAVDAARAAVSRAEADFSLEERAVAAKRSALPACNRQIVDAAAECQALRPEWHRALMREHVDAKLAAAAALFAEAYAAAIAIAKALTMQIGAYDRALYDMVIPDPTRGGSNYYFFEGRYGAPGVSMNLGRGAYQADPIAAALFEAVRKQIAPLAHVASEAASIARLEHRAAPISAEQGPSVHVVPQDHYSPPAEAELRSRFNRVRDENMWLPLERDDFESFALAYRRIGNLQKTDRFDDRDLKFWRDEFGGWAISVRATGVRVSPATYLAAAIAHGVKIELNRERLEKTKLGLAGAVCIPSAPYQFSPLVSAHSRIAS